MTRSFRPSRRRHTGPATTSAEDVIKAARAAALTRQQDYRARS